MDAAMVTAPCSIQPNLGLGMKEANSKNSVLPILGIVIAESSPLLIGFGGCDTLDFETRMLMYVCGSISFFGGLFLIWTSATRIAVGRNEPEVISSGSYLGKFRLNHYLFEAYEQGAANGVKVFRLITSPSVNRAREAAFIRYMVHEGLIQDMWPQESRQIEEAADWAFLP
jgi:hypothetical protein